MRRKGIIKRIKGNDMTNDIIWHIQKSAAPYKVEIYLSKTDTNKEVYGPFNTIVQVERCHKKHKQQRTEVSKWRDADVKRNEGP